MSDFSERLKAAITKSGVPVSRIARQSGLSQSMLYKIQSGTRLPDSPETLERLLSAMACALPERNSLLREYQVERIGTNRYRSFQELKGMLADMTEVLPIAPMGLTRTTGELPQIITGSANVNAAVQAVLGTETARPQGHMELMVPLRYGYCFESLSQALADCDDSFSGCCHLFCLQASGTDEARLHNMQALRQVLPRITLMEHYDPRYCYLPDPDNGTVLFPYFIITSGGVLMLDSTFQNATFCRETGVRDLYLKKFNVLRKQFSPILHRGGGDIVSYLSAFQALVAGPEHPRPVAMSSNPSILACIRPELAAKYFPPEALRLPQVWKAVEQFYRYSGEMGNETFFTMEGLEQLIETGVLTEIQGSGIPRISREDVLDALGELVRRSRQGNMTPYMFRENVFSGTFRFCMGLYDTKLFSICEQPQGQAVFADISEATLAYVLGDYAKCALELGDVYSPQETIALLEKTLRQYGK